MARVGIEGETLEVELVGWERVWALKFRTVSPLTTVRRISADPNMSRKPNGWRTPGLYWPGKITAGTYRKAGRRELWSLRHPEKGVIFELDGGPYDRIIVEVDDPAATVKRVRAAIGQ